MFGLRSNAQFAGATRLLDEWVTGLEGFWSQGPRAVDDTVAREVFADAAARVRKFARKGAVLEPVVPDERGLLCFELQGFDYIAEVGRFVPASPAELTEVPARLRAGLDAVRSRARAGAEEEAVYALVLAPESSAAIPVEAWYEAFRTLGVSGAAFALPSGSDPFGLTAVTPEKPGLMLALAWSGDARFASANEG